MHKCSVAVAVAECKCIGCNSCLVFLVSECDSSFVFLFIIDFSTLEVDDETTLVGNIIFCLW
jgi:hypothetical protein